MTALLTDDKAAKAVSDARYRERHHEELRAKARIRARARYVANPQLENARNSAWKFANPEKVQAAQRRRRLRRYGLTEEMFAEYLDAQEGCCAFCAPPLSKDQTQIAIDHDHRTGAFRGLVHMLCNSVMGIAETDDRLVGYLAANA